MCFASHIIDCAIFVSFFLLFFSPFAGCRKRRKWCVWCCPTWASASAPVSPLTWSAPRPSSNDAVSCFVLFHTFHMAHTSAKYRYMKAPKDTSGEQEQQEKALRKKHKVCCCVLHTIYKRNVVLNTAFSLIKLYFYILLLAIILMFPHNITLL